MAEDFRWMLKAMVACTMMSVLMVLMGWVIANIASALQSATVGRRSVVFDRDSEGRIIAIHYV